MTFPNSNGKKDYRAETFDMMGRGFEATIPQFSVVSVYEFCCYTL